jgi:hypothetical protein
MSKKLSLCFVVVDNDPGQDKIIKQQVLTKLGFFDVHYKFLDPKDYITKATNFIFDEDKFVADIDEFSAGKVLNLVACDFNLDDKIKGIDIIELIKSKSRKKLNNCGFIIHSSNISEASARFLERITNVAPGDKEKVVEAINEIIQTRIKFVSRTQYPAEIVSQLKSIQDIKSILLSSLSKVDFKIACGNVDFDGLSSQQLIDLIDKEEPKGKRFIHELIEISLAHYSNLND